MVINQAQDTSKKTYRDEKPFQSVSSQNPIHVPLPNQNEHKRTVPERLEILDFILTPAFVVSLLLTFLLVVLRQVFPNPYAIGFNFNNAVGIVLCASALLGGMYVFTRRNMREYYMTANESKLQKALYVTGSLLFWGAVILVLVSPFLLSYAFKSLGDIPF